MRIRTSTVASALFLSLAFLLAVGRWHEARSLLHPSRADAETPADYHLNPRDVYIDTGRGKIHGWYFPTDENAPTLLYIHGNADTIAKRLAPVRGYVDLGLNVFIYDPHGFGKSNGAANRYNFVDDAFAAYRYLTERQRVRPKSIYVLGQSLGGVPALRLANSEEIGGLILEGTFTSVRQMARDLYPSLPIWLLASNDYDNAKEIRRLKAPLLLINGSNDTVIAPYHSQRLFEMAPEPREYVRIEDAAHTTMFETAPETYFGAIRRFTRVAQGPRPAL